MTETTTQDVTFEDVHAQVREALLNDPRPPKGVRLGKKQTDAILAYLRAASGGEDIGPLTELAGVPILSSTSADKLSVEYDDTAEPAAEAAPPSG